MKKLLLFPALILLLHNTVFAQCSWIEGGGFLSTGQGAWSITTDAANNVYSTGAFIDSIHFGTVGLYNSTTAGSNYVNKFNTNGTIQWAVQFQTTLQSTFGFPPVICQKNGALYVAGTYYDTVYTNYSAHQLLTSPGFNVFLIKLDLNGNVLWAKTFKGSVNVYGSDRLLGITVNNKSQVYITGTFNDSLTFGSALIQAPNAQNNEAFLAKTDSNGNALWALASTCAYTQAHNRGWGITTDVNGNVLVAGSCDSSITFGAQTFYSNGPATNYNPYVAKFDSLGNCLWINGGTGSDGYVGLYCVGTDAGANVYVGGSLNHSLTFSGTTISPANGSFYVCKYSPGGNLVKLIQTGDTSTGGDQTISALSIDNANHLWISGWINSPATFGTVTLSGYGVFSAGLDTNLNISTVVQSQGTGDTYSSAVDTKGNLYVACLGGSDTLIFNGDTDLVAAIDTPATDVIYKYCVSTAGSGYHPMFGYYHVWNEDEFWVASSARSAQYDNLLYSMMYTHGDTTLFNKQYYKTKITQSDSAYPYDTTFYFREDTIAQKVWILTNDSGKEKLLYDFSLQKGDSVYLDFDFPDTTQFYYSLKTGEYYVDSVETVNIYAGPRKALFLSNPKNKDVQYLDTSYEKSREIEWIEQIGSTIAPDYLQRGLEDEGGGYEPYWGYFYILLCSYTHSGKIYHNHALDSLTLQFTVFASSDSCELVHGGGVNRVSENNEITVFPNPTSNQLNITSNQPIKQITITDLLGQQVYKSPPEDLGTKQILNVSSFATGMYFITVNAGDEVYTDKVVVSR